LNDGLLQLEKVHTNDTLSDILIKMILFRKHSICYKEVGL